MAWHLAITNPVLSDESATQARRLEFLHRIELIAAGNRYPLMMSQPTLRACERISCLLDNRRYPRLILAVAVAFIPLYRGAVVQYWPDKDYFTSSEQHGLVLARLRCKTNPSDRVQGARCQMSHSVEIVRVDASNVSDYGFFCYKSKPKSEGYQRKLAWLEGRFEEGMKLQIVHENGRSVGFVEYIPGEYAWRAVRAKNYMVIHCLWVVGRAKEKGYGSLLLDECVEDARKQGMDGVVAVTSSGTWLVDKKLFLKHGFELVDQAPPSFDLLVKRFGEAPLPSFPQNWEERARRHGAGLIVFRSDQCPYIEDATKGALDLAGESGLEARMVEVKDCRQAQDTSPSPYGVFNIVYDGQLVTYTYIGSKEKKALLRLLEEEPS